MPIKPFLARHTSEDTGSALRISIPSRKQWLIILFISIWTIGWAFGEITALGAILSGQAADGSGSFLLIWLLFWTIGGCFAVFILTWQLFGKEVIEVSSQAIITKRVLFGVGSPKEYSYEYIQALRVSLHANGDLFGWSRAGRMYGLSGGLIAFDYGAKTIHFGIGIDEAEAKQILVEITQRFPQYSGGHPQN
jgi:hypothetical protein